MATAVIAAVGEDRPGLVNELSRLVHRLNLNIEDSRMTVLGGEFAVLMSVSGGDDDLAQLEAGLATVCANAGLAHLFRRTQTRAQASTTAYRVTVVAMDHPGIVNGIARFFSERGINIRDLHTDTERAAHTGTPIFNLSMTVELHDQVDVAELARSFDGFCDAEDLDGTFEPAG